MSTDSYVVVIESENDNTHVIEVEPTESYNIVSENAQGPPGISAYQVALDEGFVGTKAEWLESLRAGIPIESTDSGKVLSNNGSKVIWGTIEDILNNSEIQWDLGDL